MNQQLQDLIHVLDLETLEQNLFRGPSRDLGGKSVFGGQVIGQALVAASRTVDNGIPHSLHAYFLRPGDMATPVVYEVDRVRDGNSFTTRRVQAIQFGKPILSMMVSFQREESGLEHQVTMPQVPPPESLATEQQLHEQWLTKAGKIPDRVREALFSILYDRVSDARVLDVFAGTGALAFEALSRGAERATLIESDAKTALLIRKNAQSLGFAARCDVMTAKADKAIATLAKGGDRFDLVFLDPPYDAGLLEPTLHQLAQSPLLTPGVLIVAEHRSSSAPPPAPPTYAMEDTRRYGEVALAFYVRESES